MNHAYPDDRPGRLNEGEAKRFVRDLHSGAINRFMSELPSWGADSNSEDARIRKNRMQKLADWTNAENYVYER